MSQPEQDAKVDFSKLELDDVPKQPRLTGRRLTKEIVLDEDEDEFDPGLEEDGEEDQTGGVFNRMRYVSKKMRKFTDKATNSVKDIVMPREEMDLDLEESKIPNEIQDESTVYPVYSKYDPRLPVYIGVGLLALILIISLSVGLSGKDDGNEASLLSDEFPPLAKEESLLEIKNQTLFGVEVGTEFVVRSNPSLDGDTLTFISGCGSTTVDCLGLGFSRSGSAFVGDCFSSCESPKSIFLNPNGESELTAAGTVVSVTNDGVVALGLFFDENEPRIELGLPVDAGQIDDPNVFVLSGLPSSHLKGVFGHVQNNVIMSIGFIVSEE